MTRPTSRDAPPRVRPEALGEPSGERLHVARLAARIMAEEGVATPAQARAKALSRLGIPGERDGPDNREIAALLYEYQRLFQAESQSRALRNEAGKGDHKQVGDVETPYVFNRYETVLADFWADVESWRG